MLLMNFKMQRKYFFQIDEGIRQILTNEAETFQSSWIGLSVKMIIRGTGIGLFVPFFDTFQKCQNIVNIIATVHHQSTH